MVGEEGMGFLNVMYNFEMERLINAARSTGFAECAFEDAARYANQRIAFGKPIGHNQMIQEKLALMAIKIDNMRNMVLKVAWQADQHQSLRTSAALAKLYCARTAMEVIDDAIQIMGGLGGAICEALAQHCCVPVELVGIQDRFGESGKPDDLLKAYNLSASDVSRPSITC